MVVRAFNLVMMVMVLACLSAVPDAYAQQTRQQEPVEPSDPAPAALFEGRDSMDALTGADYKTLVYEALEMKPGFDFGYFRSLYARLSAYEPMSDALVEEIVRLAYTVRSLPVSNERNEAMDRYTSLVLQHMANIDVAATSLALSREDTRFGNPELYEWLYRGLLRNVSRHGTGKTATDAFRVVTLGEETALLAQTRLQIIETTPFQQSNSYFNIHKVRDPKSKQEYSLFVNTSLPMRYLKEKQAHPVPPLDLGTR